MRDEAAYQLLSLGYSARETADVVSGRITLHALDTARRMMAVGLGRDEAANYLDTQYRLVAASSGADAARVLATPGVGRLREEGPGAAQRGTFATKRPSAA